MICSSANVVWLLRHENVSVARRSANLAIVFALGLLLSLCGCEVGPQLVELPSPPAEVPPANLPLGLRQENWADRNGSGSCVIASSIYHFRWQNQEQLATYFRRSYAGGQTATSIREKWRAAKIPFVSTESGDPDFLEWASRTRRGAIIWYFPSHCVHFCGYGIVDGQEVALLCDNNRVRNYIRIPKREFLANWRGYGGFACTALLPPAPPLPSVGYEVQ
jgi:hypothetical protein